MIPQRLGACFLSALVCVGLGFTWQFLTVRYNHGGNWTGLFTIGEAFPPPPALAAENLRVIPGSGYDGQMYHLVAHDPLFQKGFKRYMDNPRLRYRRILLPALAYLAVAGKQSAIDVSYIAWNLAFLFLGAWWLARYLVLSGRPPAIAILLVMVPAPVIALDRLTVDLCLTALCLGFAYYSKIDARGRLYAILVLAALSRETGVALTLALCVSELARRGYARAMLHATALLPAAVWYWFVDLHTRPIVLHWQQLMPLWGIARFFVDPLRYPFSPLVNAVITALDYVAVAGVLTACALAQVAFMKNKFGSMEIAAALWAFGALFLPQAFWQDCYSSGRVFTPLLLFLALRAADRFSVKWLVPLLMVATRTWLQVLSPALSIAKGLLHRAN